MVEVAVGVRVGGFAEDAVRVGVRVDVAVWFSGDVIVLVDDAGRVGV